MYLENKDKNIIDNILDDSAEDEDLDFYLDDKKILSAKSRLFCDERYNIYIDLVKKVKENNRSNISKYIFFYYTSYNLRLYMYSMIYCSIIVILIKNLFYKKNAISTR